MASINVTIKPEIISWVLQTVQFENVASSAIELLNKWQSGEKTPTFNQVEDISKKTNIPFGYFFLDKPPVEQCPIVDYRTANSIAIPEPSRNLMDTLDLMIDIQNWMTDYVIENGQDELFYVGSAAAKKDIKSIAEDMRKALEIQKEWYTTSSGAADSFRLLKGKLDNLGIVVMMSGIVGNNTHRKLNVEEFRAFTLVNKYAPLIFINTCDSDTGKLFSLLHELTHIWIGVNSFYNDDISNCNNDSATEQICNAVAAEILVPDDMFAMEWEKTSGNNLEKLENLSKYFRCSQYVIARKALSAEKISYKIYSEIVSVLNKQYKEWTEKQKERKNPGGDFYKNLESKLDHRFVYSLAASAREGRTQYTEVYRLTNTNRKTFGKLLADIGGATW
ncbi:MAG: ImmA/IrrE family metallo-endopeptidase [Clostridia bacterium]|nr:ImmA/IrrE family metallo-endopeptidase [Clostridia bacterium]MDY5555554.1 ImmA/IrrE family metallo-endopeptidase [Blautia sp.]